MLGYFGPEGTFTHQALRTVTDAEARPLASVQGVLNAVRSGEIEAGLVPIENSVEGGVTATLDNLAYWLSDGLSVPRRRLVAWMNDLGDTVTSVNVDGRQAYALTADLDQLHEAAPSDAVRLLPGFDPWVFGPGTSDTRLLAPDRRALATKGSNLVIRGGVVTGTWRIRGDDLMVSWFREAGQPPASALERETQRLAHLRGRGLHLTVTGS